MWLLKERKSRTIDQQLMMTAPENETKHIRVENIRCQESLIVGVLV